MEGHKGKQFIGKTWGKYRKETWTGLFAILLFVIFLPAKEILAAEPLYAGRVQTSSMTIEELEEIYTQAKELSDGYSEVIDDNSPAYFRYTASQDVDFKVWFSDSTGEENNRRLFLYWSGNKYIMSSYDNANCKVFLKKGETVYISTYELDKKDGTYKLNCSIKPAKAIQNIVTVNPSTITGYIELGDYFDLEDCVMCRKVEVTYEDGTKEGLEVGTCFSWEMDGHQEGTELGSYPFTVYYRGYPVSFTYELKSLADTTTFTPITEEQDVEVLYNNDNYTGYTFVPQKTGYYNIWGEHYGKRGRGTELIVYEKDGRNLVDNSWNDGYRELYMLEGVEYQIYVKVQDKDSKVSFWIEECMDCTEEGMMVTPVERQWYTGNPICPEPVVTYYGQDIRTLYEYSDIKYEYSRNKNPGKALITIHYRFYVNSKLHEGDIRIPFSIRGSLESAEITIDDCTYTGKEIMPGEKVILGGKELTKGKDYTVEYSNNINAGTGVMIIKGKGDYEGSIQKNFKIAKAQQEIAGNDSIKTYKEAASFSLKVKAQGKLTYSCGNKKIVTVNQKGKVTVKGYGKANITIRAAETSNYKEAVKKITVTVTSKPSKVTVVKSPSKGKIRVQFKKVKGAQGYELSCSTDKQFKKNVKRAEIKSGTKTFKKLKRKQIYYVRVRSYRKVKGKKLYSNYSQIKKVKVK